MSIESEITALREAIERLTSAITGHAGDPTRHLQPRRRGSAGSHPVQRRRDCRRDQR
ncbi:MAG: hypothetical protein MZV64_10185 [Ignavibacteriales bacterium]|nr:hypothetical protein [Ignavibacteriales bacterium]